MRPLAVAIYVALLLRGSSALPFSSKGESVNATLADLLGNNQATDCIINAVLYDCPSETLRGVYNGTFTTPTGLTKEDFIKSLEQCENSISSSISRVANVANLNGINILSSSDNSGNSNSSTTVSTESVKTSQSGSSKTKAQSDSDSTPGPYFSSNVPKSDSGSTSTPKPYYSSNDPQSLSDSTSTRKPYYSNHLQSISGSTSTPKPYYSSNDPQSLSDSTSTRKPYYSNHLQSINGSTSTPKPYYSSNDPQSLSDSTSTRKPYYSSNHIQSISGSTSTPKPYYSSNDPQSISGSTSKPNLSNGPQSSSQTSDQHPASSTVQTQGQTTSTVTSDTQSSKPKSSSSSTTVYTAPSSDSGSSTDTSADTSASTSSDTSSDTNPSDSSVRPHSYTKSQHFDKSVKINNTTTKNTTTENTTTENTTTDSVASVDTPVKLLNGELVNTPISPSVTLGTLDTNAAGNDHVNANASSSSNSQASGGLGLSGLTNAADKSVTDIGTATTDLEKSTGASIPGVNINTYTQNLTNSVSAPLAVVPNTLKSEGSIVSSLSKVDSAVSNLNITEVTGLLSGSNANSKKNSGPPSSTIPNLSLPSLYSVNQLTSGSLSDVTSTGSIAGDGKVLNSVDTSVDAAVSAATGGSTDQLLKSVDATGDLGSVANSNTTTVAKPMKVVSNASKNTNIASFSCNIGDVTYYEPLEDLEQLSALGSLDVIPTDFSADQLREQLANCIATKTTLGNAMVDASSVMNSTLSGSV